MVDYRRHKEEMAAASRQRSLSSRDIYPLPSIQNPARRMAAAKSLKLYCETYYPAKFTKPWGKNHLLLIERLEKILVSGGQQAVAMPRGTGKTTIVEAAATWALLNGYRRYLVILAANTKEARRILTSIRTALSTNVKLLADYPEVCFPLAQLNGSALLARGQLYLGDPTRIVISADSLKLPQITGSLASGATVAAFGIKAALRGQATDMPDGATARPDIIIYDDVATDAVSRNPRRVEELLHIIHATAAGLAEDGTLLSQVYCCTVNEEGDVADQLLDKSRYPQWQGIRGRSLDKFPDRMDLWREYRSVRHNDPEAANKYYENNIEVMRAGAVVTWPASYPDDCLDALQYALNKWCDYERGFWAEAQNEPQRPPAASVLVPAATIRKRVNGLERETPPAHTLKITAFVDVHDDILYNCIIAWETGFTGYVIDYNTYPEQAKSYFSKQDGGLDTLQRRYGQTADDSLFLGLCDLLRDLSQRSFAVAGDTRRIGVDRILIDAAYKPEVVENALTSVKNKQILPAIGSSIKAVNKPMSEYRKMPGMIFGNHWIEEVIQRRRFRTIRVDTNYYKSRVHEMFACLPGTSGSLSFWGQDAGKHRMIADHCNAETVRLVSSGRNEVNEWRELPARPDNHFFDCLVGATVAASTLYLDRETKRNGQQ